MAIVFIYECFETWGCGLDNGKVGIPLYGFPKSHECDLKAMANPNMFCLYQNPELQINCCEFNNLTDLPSWQEGNCVRLENRAMKIQIRAIFAQ